MRITILLITIICIVFTTSADLFAQDAKNVEQVGRIYNQWVFTFDVFITGDLAYVATGTAGLQIVNVSDPENLDVIAYWDDNPGGAYGVTVSGDYAYVADGECGLCVVNISDPENPVEAGHVDTPGHAFGVAVSGDYAYIADGDHGLRVVNISDPENPEDAGY